MTLAPASAKQRAEYLSWKARAAVLGFNQYIYIYMYLIVNIYAVKCYGSIYMIMIMYIYSIHMLGDI